MSRSEAPDHADGWFFFAPDAVPERWKDRAMHVALVRLLPGEATELFWDRAELPPRHDRAFLELVARGLSNEAIATRLDISSRSVQRRLATLEKDLGVGSKAEVASELARRGF